MAIFKKHSTACIVAALIIVFGTLFGVHRSVEAQTRKIEAMFYDGVYLKDEKYTQPGIGEQLDARATAALGLVTVGAQFGDDHNMPELTDALRQARLALMDAETIPEKYLANKTMQSAYEALYLEIMRYDLTGTTLAAVQSYAETFDGAQSMIDRSAYNDAVSSFRQELRAFPVGILRNLAYVTVPEYFGAEG
jgi:hypothetical protein